MYTTDLKELYGKDYHISGPVAVNQTWENGSIFQMKTPRKNSGLIYMKNCSATFIFDCGKLTVSRGSIVYIPQGQSYILIFDDVAQNVPYTSQLINIEFFDTDHQAFILCKDICVISSESGIYEEYFDEAVRICAAQKMSYSLLRSVIYSLMHTISSKYNNESIYTKKNRKIVDGITYLEQNLNSDISIEKIAKMCYLSPARFRAIFNECMGMSPREYKIMLKMNHAKRLLKGGFFSVSEIAQMLGYNDVSYFSRFFKERTSLSPKEFIKQNK